MTKVRVDLSEGLGQIKDFGKKGTKAAGEILKDEIVDSISRGVSPVKRAGGRFQRYSDSYRQAIDSGRYRNLNKRKRPVNLKLSGKLLKSIFSRVISSNRLEIGFDDKLADIHNRQGAGKSGTVRRMLPTNPGETFSDSILIAVGRRLQLIASRIFK